MVAEGARWVSYDEAATLLGLSPESARRLALRRGWPRRADATRGPQVAIPATLAEDGGGEEEVAPDFDQIGARTLLEHLELRVEQLAEELAEARTEMRGVRYEAESLRVEAGRAQVFAALVDAERARSAEIRAERDRLADDLARSRRTWLDRLFEALLARPRTRQRPF